MKPNPVRYAAFLLGSQTALAIEIGVAPQFVSWMCRTGHVPAARVLAIEAATRGEVTRHMLRPDLYPL
jgi:DNA-binding transcriptional regulator YdaS (Cro superfamily)